MYAYAYVPVENRRHRETQPTAVAAVVVCWFLF